MKENLPTGFKCVVCDRPNGFNDYVFAHWDIDLIFTCGCGSRYSILRGNSRLLKRHSLIPKKVKK